MARSILIILGFLTGFWTLAGTAPAWAQASPMAPAPMGTPMTPQQIGSWMTMPGISESEAAYDARNQGYVQIMRMHEDSYGDWIGQSGSHRFIVFPDGRAYPF